MKHRSAAGLAGLVLALLLTAPAVAAPVTVDLRIEGANATLFEGKVTTDVRGFRFSGDPVEHVCDGTAANSGPSQTPVPTRGAALAEAAERTPFAIAGTWNAQFGAPTFSTVLGENVEYDPADRPLPRGDQERRGLQLRRLRRPDPDRRRGRLRLRELRRPRA